MMGNVLQASQLSLGYNGLTIVQDFHMKAHSGRIIGLVGPNGSGKTTILRALAGLLKPKKGEVYIQGLDMNKIDSRTRARKIAWVPQRETMTWSLSVEETIQLGRAPHRGWLLPYTAGDHDKVNWALDLTELNNLKERPINKLSGGEFQRVLIARALAQDPIVLLLDEPTANLDVHHQIQVLDLIKNLVVQNNLSVIIAIHDLNLAVRYCDQIHLLDHGQQIGKGKPQDVLTEENLRSVFGIKAKLYQDPWGYWALSVRSNND